MWQSFPGPLINSLLILPKTLYDSGTVNVTAGDPCILAEVKIESPGTYHVDYSVDTRIVMNLKQIVLEYLRFKIAHHGVTFPLETLPPEIKEEVEGPGELTEMFLYLNGKKVQSIARYGHLRKYVGIKVKKDDILQCRVAPCQKFDREISGSLAADSMC